MILWCLNYLCGFYCLSGERRLLPFFLNFCREKCAPYWSLTLSDENFSVCLRRSLWRELKSDAEARGLVLFPVAEYGLPQLIRRYRRRWGGAVGILFCVLIVWMSGRFVWRIEVVGTEQYSTRDVLEELDIHGFAVGSYIPAVDVNRLQNRLLADSTRFAWISVNLFGTTAQVEVVEIRRKSDPSAADTPMNLTAAYDGQITLLSVRSGWPTVAIGDVVRQGELLVSGLGETSDGRSRAAAASGEIYAQVIHDLTVEVPFNYTIKRYSGECKHEKSIIFFGKEIKLSRNTGILGATCDTIENERILTFFDRITVPILLRTTEWLAYEAVPAERSEEDARALAGHMLRRKCEALLTDAELVGRSVRETRTENGIQLDCTLYCVRNIAVPAPILLSTPTE